MMQRLSALLPSLRVSLAAGLACVISFVAGYLLAGWWSDAHDTTPLEQICDHVNSLEEEFPNNRTRRCVTSLRRLWSNAGQRWTRRRELRRSLS